MFKKILSLTTIMAIIFIGYCFFCFSINNQTVQAQQGSTIIVAKDGTGNYTTIQPAVDNINPGDTILIKAGTYAEKVTISKSGTVNNPIIIQNYNNDIVKINATAKEYGISFNNSHYVTIKDLTIYGANIASADAGNIILKHASSHITIQDCDIYDGKYGILNASLWTDHNPSYISIINSKIHHNTKQGIRIFATKTTECNHILISGNDIYHNGNIGASKVEWDVGVYLRCDYSSIENNNIYNNAGEGIFMDAFLERHYHHNIIKNNHIYNNGYNGIMFAAQDYCLIYDNNIHNNGLYFDTHEYNKAVHGIYTGYDPVYNIFYNNAIYNHKYGSAIRPEGLYNMFRDNIFYNNGYGFGQTNVYGSCYGHIVRRNLVYKNTDSHMSIGWPMGSGMEADGTQEMHLYNNVFFDNQGYGIAFVQGHQNVHSIDNKIKNNIIMSTDLEHVWIGDRKGLEENYNNIYPDKSDAVRIGPKHNYINYWLNGYKSLTGQGSHTISQNPLFQDPDNGNFHLQSNSPVIDKGGFLTKTTSSGSGTQIRVEDAKYFCDGFDIAQGDIIQLENQTQTARITNINYDNNTITIDTSLSWNSGQGVALAYQGSSPDIGVYEYSSMPQQPNITLTKSADKTQTTSGDEIKYTIHYHNSSQTTAYNVKITDDIPVNTTYLSGGQLSDNTVIWDLGDVGKGEQGDVELRVRVE